MDNSDLLNILLVVKKELHFRLKEQADSAFTDIRFEGVMSMLGGTGGQKGVGKLHRIRTHQAAQKRFGKWVNALVNFKKLTIVHGLEHDDNYWNENVVKWLSEEPSSSRTDLVNMVSSLPEDWRIDL